MRSTIPDVTLSLHLQPFKWRWSRWATFGKHCVYMDLGVGPFSLVFQWYR